MREHRPSGRVGYKPGVGGGGGGHCLFGRSYPMPNYRPRFSGLSAPEFSLTAPYFWELQTTAL